METGTILFKTEKVTDRITRIYGIAGELMYLAEGDCKAALIDTGVGVGNLRELVRSLTKKDVYVLLSHGHVDHALGAGVFEQRMCGGNRWWGSINFRVACAAVEIDAG